MIERDDRELREAIDPAQSLQDWAERGPIRHLPPAPPPDWSRRQLAVLMVVIALLFPFYSYFVQRELMELEMEAAARELETAAAAERQRLAQQQAQAAGQRAANQQRAAAEDLQRRIAAVRVKGAMEGRPPTVLAVDIPPEGAAVADAVICRQAAAYLRRPLRGETLKVLRDRGGKPASEAGLVVCP